MSGNGSLAPLKCLVLPFPAAACGWGGGARKLEKTLGAGEFTVRQTTVQSPTPPEIFDVFAKNHGYPATELR